MLSRWGIWNFKSIGTGVELKFRKITLLVGANSSGKSSIVQTVLLLKQTFQYGQRGTAVLLNGPLVRLGNFDDVRNAQNRQRSFSLLFDLTVNEELLRQLANRPKSGGLLSISSAPQIKRIEASFQVGVGSKTKDELQLQQPFLRNSVLTVDHTTGKKEMRSEIEVRRARPTPPEQRTYSSIRKGKGQKLTDLRVSRISRDLKEELSQARPRFMDHGAYSRFFLPESIFVSYDAKLKAASEIAEYLSSPHNWLTTVPTLTESLFFQTAKHVVLDWLRDRIGSEVYEEAVESIDLKQLSEAIEPVVRELHPQQPRSPVFRGLLVAPTPSSSQIERLQDLRSRLYRSIISLPEEYADFDVVSPRALAQASQDLEDYFKFGVRYLGPIRDAPKPLYPLEPLSDPTDVGYSGEHTAAVYDLNKSRVIRYVRPPREGVSTEPAIHTATLHEAAVDWLSHMGVVSGINATDRGKFGRELQVQTPGLTKYHDLTNVGVGVSQVLPIVVMALLAGQGSLLVFEQPELHLHPKVQARLADFFIAMTAMDKQCLVETHSEYLIYRLRRRIAEAEGDSQDDLVALYFVERVAGETRIRPVGINRFGALAEWPKDFFDQSQDEAEHIIRAAARKHKAARDGKPGGLTRG